LGLILNLALVHFQAGRQGFVALEEFDPWAVLLGVSLAFLPWFFGALRLRVWTSGWSTSFSFRSALRVVVSTEVLAAATPTAVGGAPAKATMLYREGMSPGSALALTALGSLEDTVFFALSVPAAIWLSPSIGFQELARFLRDSFRVAERDGFPGFLLPIGLILAATVAFAIVDRRLHGRFRSKIGAIRETVGRQVRTAALLLWKERRRLLLTLPLTAFQWSARYTVVSVLAFGLGLPVDVFLFFVVQCLIFSVLVLVPSPGASGGAEAVFLLFHRNVPGAEVVALLLAWRTLTFFLPVAVGAIGVVWFLRADEKTEPFASSLSPKPDLFHGGTAGKLVRLRSGTSAFSHTADSDVRHSDCRS